MPFLQAVFDFLVQVFAVAVAPAAIVAGVAYLLRGWFQQWLTHDADKFRAQLQRDLEAYKAELQQQTDAAQRQLQTELDRQRFAYETRYGPVHARQVEVVGTLYGQLRDVHSQLKDVISPKQIGGIQILALAETDAATAYNAMTKYFLTNRLFLDEAVADDFDAVIESLLDAFEKWRRAHEPNASQVAQNGWDAAWETVQTDIPVALKSLEQQARAIINPPK